MVQCSFSSLPNTSPPHSGLLADHLGIVNTSQSEANTDEEKAKEKKGPVSFLCDKSVLAEGPGLAFFAA